jgi:hypothetical protein
MLQMEVKYNKKTNICEVFFLSSTHVHLSSSFYWDFYCELAIYRALFSSKSQRPYFFMGRFTGAVSGTTGANSAQRPLILEVGVREI